MLLPKRLKQAQIHKAYRRAERAVADGANYRRYALQCFEWSRLAESEKDRDTFLEMAKAWLQIAALAEPETPILPASMFAKLH